MQAFSQEHFLSGLNCFQRLSAVDSCTYDCGHKLGAKKEKYNVDFLLDTMALKYKYIFLSEQRRLIRDGTMSTCCIALGEPGQIRIRLSI